MKNFKFVFVLLIAFAFCSCESLEERNSIEEYPDIDNLEYYDMNGFVSFNPHNCEPSQLDYYYSTIGTYCMEYIIKSKDTYTITFDDAEIHSFDGISPNGQYGSIEYEILEIDKHSVTFKFIDYDPTDGFLIAMSVRRFDTWRSEKYKNSCYNDYAK